VKGLAQQGKEERNCTFSCKPSYNESPEWIVLYSVVVRLSKSSSSSTSSIAVCTKTVVM
jgi:hypothetical protein